MPQGGQQNSRQQFDGNGAGNLNYRHTLFTPPSQIRYPAYTKFAGNKWVELKVNLGNKLFNY